MNSKLKFLRKELGLSQIELSMVSKVPRYKIQLCEQGVQCLSQAEANRLVRKLDQTHSGMPKWIVDLVEAEGADDGDC